jgi:hypothetical protein
MFFAPTVGMARPSAFFSAGAGVSVAEAAAQGLDVLARGNVGLGGDRGRRKGGRGAGQQQRDYQNQNRSDFFHYVLQILKKV